MDNRTQTEVERDWLLAEAPDDVRARFYRARDADGAGDQRRDAAPNECCRAARRAAIDEIAAYLDTHEDAAGSVAKALRAHLLPRPPT
jgi:hypothetical protein